MLRLIMLAILFQLQTLSGFCQTPGWTFDKPTRKRVSIPFEIVNNLIIIKLHINGSKALNFILDTGLKSTLVTELSYGDSLTLNNATEVSIQGLGDNEAVKAYQTTQNTVRLGRAQGENQNLIVLMDNVFHLSEKLGITINGIIGYDFFKSFVVQISYTRHRIYLYRPEDVLSLPKGYVNYPVSWNAYKPYIDIDVCTQPNDSIVKLHMLIDTGSSDALWIFKESIPNYTIPKRNVHGYLGRGLSGDIYGTRARIEYIQIADRMLKQPVVAFPDSSELLLALKYRKRNGSLGGEILRRFDIWFNYPGSQVAFKPSSRTRESFFFNVSGIELSSPYPGLSIFIISEIEPSCNAAIAGLEAGDRILEVDNRPADGYTLEQMQHQFFTLYNRRMRLTVIRNNIRITFSFILKPLI